MTLTIMHRDIPILTTSYDRQTHKFTRILGVDRVDHAPAATFGARGRVTLGGVNSWWESRAISRIHDGLARLVGSLGLDGFEGLVECSHALSLSDTY